MPRAKKRDEPDLPTKAAVIAALRGALERALASMASAAAQTAEGVVHEDARAEGDKDMRGTVESYIARGQAMRAEQIADELGRLDTLPRRAFAAGDRVEAGALVRALVDEEPRVLFVCPHGAGTELEVDGARVTVVTPSAPLGRAILGKRVGDVVEIRLHGALREVELDAIA